MDTKKLSVIKIPNNNVSENENVEDFPRMPRMYLELLENKEKIKPELVNREYDPDDAESILSFYSSKNDKSIQKPESRMPQLIEKEEKESDNDLDDDSDEDDKSVEDNDSVEDDDSFKEEEEEDDLDSFVKEDISLSQSSDNKSFQQQKMNNDEIRFSDNESQFDENDEVYSHKSFVSEKNDTRDKLKELLKSEVKPSPPRLSDLENAGMLKQNRTIPNLEHLEVQEDEDEEDKKRELLFKFELLKKSYKNVNIPEFSIHSNLKKMNETYENQLRHLSLDSSVESYKNILVGGFMIFEFIFGVWFKFDMSGFTQQQILNMNQYERLLIELGQKSYVPEGEQWPVEFRLLGLIVLNAVIFIISKMILKKTGNNLMGMMNHVQSSVPKSTNNTPSEPKKKMKGPSINIDDM